MPKPRINKRASNIRAQLKIDPASWKEFEKAMKQIEIAVRKQSLEKAMLAGGEIIRSAAESKAPGPYIEMEVMTGSELIRGWKRSAQAQGFKADAVYAVIGPDKAHWHYRFSEYGVKAHGVTQRKRTRKQQDFRVKKIRSRDVRPSLKTARPRMVFEMNGELVFAKTVRGFAARPFLRPAIDTQGATALKTVGNVLGAEIEKAARS